MPPINILRCWTWLAEHPRWTFHFTPTSCSWFNAVKGFFSKLTRQSLKRGVFRSVPDPRKPDYLLHRRHQQEPQPLRLDRDCKNHPGQAHAEPSVSEPDPKASGGWG